MVDDLFRQSRFQAQFPGKADPNDFLTPSDPGVAGLGTLWASSVGTKAAKEAATSALHSAQFINAAVHGQIEPYVFDEEAGGMVPNPAWTAGTMETALNVAGPSFTRSVLGSKGVADPNTLGIFASTGAKTANTEALDVAKTMFLEGKNRDEIRAATGWFPSADGVWRFEIKDTGAKINRGSLTTDQLVDGVPLKDVLEHPEFFKAYPEAANLTYKEEALRPGNLGYFNPGNDSIVTSIGLQFGNKDRAVEGTTLHELQHWVQQKEGMAKGSNPRVETDYRAALVKDALEREKAAAESEGLLKRLARKLTGKKEPTEEDIKKSVGFSTYANTHGEVESRNVEKRFLTGDYETQPWKTIDRPAERVIVDEGGAYSELLRQKGERDPWANVGFGEATERPVFGYAGGGLVGGQLDQYLEALGSIESSNNYGALGPETESGDRAYGRYQVMGANIPSWTKEALGRSLTPQQFLEDRDAQNAVARHRFGQYVEKYGNPYDAASAWFSGRPMAQAGQSADVTGTNVPEYVSRFAKALGQPMDRGQSAEGIASLEGELESLRRQRAAMGEEPSGRQRQRMIAAITDFYESTKPQEADFSLLRPMGRRG